MTWHQPPTDDELADLSPHEARARGLLRQHYQALRRLGRLHGSITRALRVRKKRDQRQAPIVRRSLAQRLHDSRLPVELAGWQEREARDTAEADYPRRRNWESPRPSICDGGHVQVEAVDNGRYSSRCKYTHWTYRIYVQSYGRLVSGGVWYHYRGTKLYYPHPHGYRWTRDTLGLTLVSRSNPRDDYHPTGGDLLSNLGQRVDLRSLTRKVRDNAARRRAARKQDRHERAAIARAEREGATVCLADSKRAGNCVAGSRTWCRAHGLDATRHYRPSELVALANGQQHRVALAVQAALRRHRREMAQGYAVLADHTI